MAVPSPKQHLPSFLLVFLCVFSAASAAKRYGDLAASASIASDSLQQSVSATSRRMGYPYAIAPALTPVIHSRSDENEAEVHDMPAKAFVNKVLSSNKPSSTFLKKSGLKKLKPLAISAARRQGYVDTPSERILKSYREPQYRNFADLESMFRPRRYDLDGAYEYRYEPKVNRRPAVSPRDPYLSPSHEPSDTFYPTVPKLKSFSEDYGQRIRGSTAYGAGSYEDTHGYPYDTQSGYDDTSYGSQYTKDSTYYDDYTVKSNQPIIGEIRKRLLDHAGASDMYEGEPDYLQQIAENKNKYGSIGNDYYTYGRPGYGSEYNYPYLEKRSSTLKKQRI